MILILNDREHCKTAAGFLTMAMEHSFPNESVLSVSLDDFKHALRHENPEVIVLPEIREETNYYPVTLGQEGKQLIQSHVRKRGAMYFGLCAGAYNACSYNFYKSVNGEIKESQADDLLELTLFHAKGTIPRHGIVMDGEKFKERGHSCERVKVEFLNHATAIPEVTDVWYENGPLFHDRGEDIMPRDDVEIIVRYRLPSQRPVAAFKQRVGNGKIMLSGVLAHLNDEKLEFTHPLWLTYVDHIKQHLFEKRNGIVLQPAP